MPPRGQARERLQHRRGRVALADGDELGCEGLQCRLDLPEVALVCILLAIDMALPRRHQAAWRAWVQRRRGSGFSFGLRGRFNSRDRRRAAHDAALDAIARAKNRSGTWDIWRIPSTGGGPNDIKAERITSDEWEDWFPHFSPDGKRMIMLSFPPGTSGHNGKMPGMAIRLYKKNGKHEILTEFFGGQGTMNVNSWSPDGRQFAYVVYEPR